MTNHESIMRDLDSLRLQIQTLETKVDEIFQTIWRLKAKAASLAALGALLGSSFADNIQNWFQVLADMVGGLW